MTNLCQTVQAIEKGITWLKSMQNRDGSFGRWGLGSTCLAMLALLHCGEPKSELAVSKAFYKILNWEPLDSTYFCSLGVMALIEYGRKTHDVIIRVERDVEKLVGTQGSDPANAAKFGGWGHYSDFPSADGSSTFVAMLALHFACSWGIAVSQEIWDRALTWHQKNYALNNDGRFVFSLANDPRNNDQGITYAMTAGALSSLKIINLYSTDEKVKSQAKFLIDKAVGWLNDNYLVKLYWSFRESWHFFYLYSLYIGCVLVLPQVNIGTGDWYVDIADYLITQQKTDGNWVGETDKNSTDVIYTSLALLILSNGYNNEPTVLDDPKPEEYSNQDNSKYDILNLCETFACEKSDEFVAEKKKLPEIKEKTLKLTNNKKSNSIIWPSKAKLLSALFFLLLLFFDSSTPKN